MNIDSNDVVEIMILIDKIKNRQYQQKKITPNNKILFTNNNIKSLINQKYHHQYCPYQEENYTFQYPI